MLVRLKLEELEARAVPALFTWAYNGLADFGKWSVVANWLKDGAATATLPTLIDDVAFGANTKGCQIDVANAAVKKLTLSGFTGKLSIDQGLSVWGGGAMDSGTITYQNRSDGGGP